jgi:hypothetical protein
MFIPAGVVASSLGDIRDHFGTNLHSAYSVRKLNAYSSFGFVIRRTVDDEEANLYYDDLGNISFTSVVSGFSSGSSASNLGQFMAAPGYTDADSLGSVASAAVVTWKDQGGSGRDVTNATEARQPTIVSGAVLKTENAIAALDFSGNMLTHSDGSAYAQPNTYVAVVQSDVTTGSDYFIDGDGSASNDRHVVGHSNNKKKIHADDWAGTASADTDQNLWFVMVNGASTAIHISGASDSAGGEDPGDYDMSGFTIGARHTTAGSAWDGRIQEILYFRGDQSAIRGDLEDDVNRYYSIY